MISYYYLVEGLSALEKTSNFFNRIVHGSQGLYSVKTPGRAFLKKALMILTAYHPQRCEDLGLWPGLNRLVAKYALDHGNPVHQEDLSFIIFYPKRGLFDLCGEIGFFEFSSIYSFNPKDFNSLNKFGREALEEYAKLFKR